MKIIFTKHAAIDKFLMLKKHNFKTKITKRAIKDIIQNPENEDKDSDLPKTIASKTIDERHILREGCLS